MRSYGLRCRAQGRGGHRGRAGHPEARRRRTGRRQIVHVGNKTCSRRERHLGSPPCRNERGLTACRTRSSTCSASPTATSCTGRWRRRAGVTIAPAAGFVLRHVVANGPERPAVLAERMRMQPSALSRQLKVLEADGYIERVPIDGDKRGWLLRATRRGRGVVQRLERADEGILAEQLRNWSPTDLDTLNDLLDRLIHDLRAPAPADPERRSDDRDRSPTDGQEVVPVTEVTESTITFPYKRSLGPVIGAFMTGAHRAADPRDPQRRPRSCARRWSGTRTPAPSWPDDFVEVGPAGTVESWTWVPRADRAAPARPAVRLRPDPARRRRHAAAARRRRRVASTPCRPACGWRPAGAADAQGPHHRHRRPSCPARSPQARRRAPAPAEPVTMMDYNASITYRNPVTEQRGPGRAGHRARAASSACKCPVCGRVYTGGKGYCPIDAIELDPGARGRPAPDRRDHQLHDHHARSSTRARPRPSRSPGCTSCSTAPTWCSATRPSSSVPDDEVRIGMQRRARCGPRRARRSPASALAPTADLVGWIPTGEPDIDDPDLVNRII